MLQKNYVSYGVLLAREFYEHLRIEFWRAIESIKNANSWINFSIANSTITSFIQLLLFFAKL